jgi:hypothetical protein
MATVKKPVKKAPTKTLPADDFDNNPATIMRNGGKVKKKAMGGKVMPKKSMGGKMKKGC